MLNKVQDMLRRYDMVRPGDTVTVAVSGGADSTALLYAMYLLRDKLGITLEAVHFNHNLRGVESARDEDFVRELCKRYDIPLHLGSAQVTAGEKGLEAAAREARYAWFSQLPGKVATAHTADDNAETVLMRMVRGTGLKGLGGIAPVRDNIIRPMLTVTRREVLAFLQNNYLRFVEDSSNAADDFFRNRIRHHVMPLLNAENPRLAENLSAMAMKLREDEKTLSGMILTDPEPEVQTLRDLPAAIRSRSIAAFLERTGVREPEAEHIDLVEKLVFSEKPSARADLPGGVTASRKYGKLTAYRDTPILETVELPHRGVVELLSVGLRVSVTKAEETENAPDCFTVCSTGKLVLRHRLSGDEIRLSGGKKSLKKLFIDRKIPAKDRLLIPVIADETGILGIYGFGADMDRLGPGVRIRIEKIEEKEKREVSS